MSAPIKVSAAHQRALRGAALAVQEAERARAAAILAAHEAGASLADIARLVAMDALEVRGMLDAAGALPALQPKEAAGRTG